MQQPTNTTLGPQEMVAALGPMQEELNVSAVVANAGQSELNTEQSANFNPESCAPYTPLAADVIANATTPDAPKMDPGTNFNM